MMSVFQVKAQQWPDHRWDNWIFGENNGWTFTNGSATPLSGSSVPGYYSTTVSASDPYTGDLFFYGNEGGLWDRNGSPFPTCICPQFGSTGDPNVIALPGAPGIHYLFFSAAYDNVTPSAYSLRYAVINMALNGGLGDVNATQNVIALDAHRYAILPAVGHDSLWLVAEIGNTNGSNWYSFPITQAGIGPAQWVHTSYPWSGGQNVQLGDRSGTRFISSTSGSAYLLYHFDPATGQLSDQIDLLPSLSMSTAELSPDGEKLYVLYLGVSGPLLDQFDLSTWDATSIIASRITLAYSDSSYTANRDIRLAPDGRIYLVCGSADSTSLWVINAPNVAGAGCDLQPYSVPLSPDVTAGMTPRLPVLNWPRPLNNVGVHGASGISTVARVAPNPATDRVTLTLPAGWSTGGVAFRWLDAVGRVVRSGRLPGAGPTVLERGDLAPGSYLLVLDAPDGGTRTVRVVWE